VSEHPLAPYRELLRRGSENYQQVTLSPKQFLALLEYAEAMCTKVAELEPKGKA
jgi:hypothetical protein